MEPDYIIIRTKGTLWQLSCFYAPEGKPTRVSSSLHRTRAEAVQELRYFFAM